MHGQQGYRLADDEACPYQTLMMGESDGITIPKADFADGRCSLKKKASTTQLFSQRVDFRALQVHARAPARVGDVVQRMRVEHKKVLPEATMPS